ncbi:glycosyl hydrolase [Parvularcula marina]|uniref:Endoglucanase n=2 Tax=Parvularcula marina TaxID=2292771 RepID=A0A371RFT8_9PROT|nr:glycosyl hydrolase [Parvularcula marina]
MIALTCGLMSAACAEPVGATSVDLNQHGFLPKAPKGATVITDATAPLVWQVVDASGEVLAEGESEVFGDDAASGQHVHRIDFSSLKMAGEGYVLQAGGETSVPFDIGTDVYDNLKYDALAFFYHQRASTPIEAEYVGEVWARPTAHDPDEATCYGPEDVRGNDWGGCPYTLDVSRGWYDAGDQGKYVVNGGISVWTLLNYYEWAKGAPAFMDGDVRIPEAGNGVSDLLDEARWEMEFMLAMQVPEGTTLRLPRGNQYRNLEALVFNEVDASGMAHHKMADEYWTALPTPPHEDPATRYLHYPSTAASLNLAATAAQCARIWQGLDGAFAARCLDAAERAYAAAKRLPDIFPITVTDGGSGGYGDGQLEDEFYWAATELYLATGKPSYEEDMRGSKYFLSMPGVANGRDISWGSVDVLGTLSLLVADSDLSAEEIELVQSRLFETADRFAAEAEAEGYGVPFSRSYNWGSNGDMSNRGIILAYAYNLTGKDEYFKALTGVLDYLLGRNPLKQSYVAGYGENPMKAPHHRFWLRVLDEDLPPPPPGALAGGPNGTNAPDEVIQELKEQGCVMQTCYADDYRAYSLNEVAINWNAPFFWVAAAYDRLTSED